MPECAATHSGSLRDARVSGRTQAPEGMAPLSLGHNSSNPQNQTLAEKKKPSQTSVKLWPKGSRADFPGIEFSNRKPKHSPPPKRTPRGCIQSLSASSRRNLKLTLHTITFEALAYTMALTMPGSTEGISGPFAKDCFITLCNRMSASRIPIIKIIGMMWKQELQKRGEVHFHLVLYGVTEETRRSVQRWIAEQWNNLICIHSTPEDRANHLWWHLRDGSTKDGKYNPKSDNMQEVRNFAGYFAKYLGKEEQAQASRDPIPGRWWGKVNSKNIPWAEKKELELPPRMRIHCQRIARKIRQKRANAAKFLRIMREADLLRLTGKDKGQPAVSEFALTLGFVRKGTRLGDLFRESVAYVGKRLGKEHLHPSTKYSSVKLTGEGAVTTGKRILEYAAERYKEELENCPF